MRCQITTEVPTTSAVRFLSALGIYFEPFTYNYLEHGGTKHASQELNVPHNLVIKTIVLKEPSGRPLLVLMHGDCEISLKTLARHLQVKSLTRCSEEEVLRHTGYIVGGVSPFGTRKKIDLYIESSILALDNIYINGGKRGLLLKMDPQDLIAKIPLSQVEVSIPHNE